MILNSINTGLFRPVGMMDFKHDGENLLRASGAEYTVVRPGRLLDGRSAARPCACASDERPVPRRPGQHAGWTSRPRASRR